jgi:hypothetical protein
MWPWEHLAVGYLCYSLAVHAFAGRAPRGLPAIALALGTQFPDLVDKPLAWTFAVVPAGHSLAHSLLVALPVSMFVVTAARSFGHRQVGVAFAFGYLSHLPADAFYPVLLGGVPNVGFLLWPVVPAVEPRTGLGFVEMVRLLFARYVTELRSGQFTAYLAAEVGLLASAFLLWLYDGAPPLCSLWSRVRLGPEIEETP